MSKTYLMYMSAQRLRWLAGFVSLFGVLAGRAQAAAVADAQRAAPTAEGRPPVIFGLMADAGVPDGAIGAFVIRPADWLRLHVGAGTNTVSAGYRGGVTVVPFGWGPSLSFEAGNFRAGDANGLVRQVVGARASVSSLFGRVGYTYYNMQLGLELGRGSLQFFIHGGVSFLRATLPDATAALTAVQNPKDATSVELHGDPVVRVWTPSLKLGLAYYFDGAR